MSRTVLSILVVSVLVAAADRAMAMDFVTHSRASGVQPFTWAMLAVAIATVGVVVRAHRRYVSPRLVGGLMSWAERQHGRRG